MAKFFISFFLVALCLVQNFSTTLAESEEEQANFQNIVKIIEHLALEIKQVVQDLSDRLPKIVKKLEKSIKSVVEDVNLTEIFESVKEEIEEIISNESSTTIECSNMAYEELDDLNEKIRTDITNCITRAEKKTNEIKDEVEELMQKANYLAGDMKNKIEKCAEEYSEDANGMLNCLETEVIAINKLLKQLKDAIKATVDVTENVAEEVAEDVDICLKEVKIDALKNTEHVTDELTSCINEG